MNHNNLWYSPKTKLYYFSDLKKECDKCKESILDIGFNCLFVRTVTRKEDKTKIYCEHCAINLQSNPLTLFESKGTALIVSEKPQDCILVINEKISLKSARDFDLNFNSSKGLSTFDLEQINKLGGVIVDKTVFAGRDNLFINDNSKEILKICQEKDKPINDLKEVELILKNAKTQSEVMQNGNEERDKGST